MIITRLRHALTNAIVGGRLRTRQPLVACRVCFGTGRRAFANQQYVDTYACAACRGTGLIASEPQT